MSNRPKNREGRLARARWNAEWLIFRDAEQAYPGSPRKAAAWLGISIRHYFYLRKRLEAVKKAGS